MNFSRYIIIGLFCMIMNKGNAQFIYTDQYAKAHQSILLLDFEKTETLLLSTSYPNGVYIWLQAYRDFLIHFSSPEVVNYTDLNYQLDKSIEAIKQLKNNDPYYYSCLADIYLMKSYWHYISGDYLRAIANYSQANGQINELTEKFPDSELVQRFKIIKITVDALIKDMLQFSTSTSEKETTETKFRSLLSQTLSDNRYSAAFKSEISLMGVICYSVIDPSDDGGYGLMQIFGQNWSVEGPLQAFLFSINASKAGHFSESMKVLNKAVQLKYNQRYNHINLLIGNALLNQLNDSCITYFNTFIHHQNNLEDVAYARLKLAWWHALAGQKNDVEHQSQLILNNTFPSTPFNKQALYENSLQTNWLPELIKARLLFDGGNYTECRDWLLANQYHVPYYNEQQKLEFAYRMARACDKTNQWEYAIKFYHMAMNSGLEKYMYYPCYSAYYLGNIYIQQKKTELAHRYFNICLQMDSPIYKESIHQKARKHLLIRY